MESKKVDTDLKISKDIKRNVEIKSRFKICTRTSQDHNSFSLFIYLFISMHDRVSCLCLPLSTPFTAQWGDRDGAEGENCGPLKREEISAGEKANHRRDDGEREKRRWSRRAMWTIKVHVDGWRAGPRRRSGANANVSLFTIVALRTGSRLKSTQFSQSWRRSANAEPLLCVPGAGHHVPRSSLPRRDCLRVWGSF